MPLRILGNLLARRIPLKPIKEPYASFLRLHWGKMPFMAAIVPKTPESKVTFSSHSWKGSNLQTVDISSEPNSCSRGMYISCLLYTSDAADEEDSVDLGGRR